MPGLLWTSFRRSLQSEAKKGGDCGSITVVVFNPEDLSFYLHMTCVFYYKSLWAFCCMLDRIIGRPETLFVFLWIHICLSKLSGRTIWIISTIRLEELCFYFPADCTKWVLIPSSICSRYHNKTITQITAIWQYEDTNAPPETGWFVFYTWADTYSILS